MISAAFFMPAAGAPPAGSLRHQGSRAKTVKELIGMSIFPAKSPEGESVVEKRSSAPSIFASGAELGRIAAAAINGYPNEVCGVLVGRMDGSRAWIEHTIEGTNLNTDRARDRYQLDPADYLGADRWALEHGLEIIGFWHSHPNHPPFPSQTDLDHAWPGYSYLIVSVGERRQISLRSWRLDGDTFVEERIEP